MKYLLTYTLVTDMSEIIYNLPEWYLLVISIYVAGGLIWWYTK